LGEEEKVQICYLGEDGDHGGAGPGSFGLSFGPSGAGASAVGDWSGDTDVEKASE
jgi:hypothetical protein